MSKDQPTQSDIQPEGGVRRLQNDEPNDTDAEGHAVRGKDITEDQPESDVVVGGEELGPDGAAKGWSDRNLKVHIVPVTW